MWSVFIRTDYIQTGSDDSEEAAFYSLVRFVEGAESAYLHNASESFKKVLELGQLLVMEGGLVEVVVGNAYLHWNEMTTNPFCSWEY